MYIELLPIIIRAIFPVSKGVGCHCEEDELISYIQSPGSTLLIMYIDVAMVNS